MFKIYETKKRRVVKKKQLAFKKKLVGLVQQAKASV